MEESGGRARKISPIYPIFFSLTKLSLFTLRLPTYRTLPYLPIKTKPKVFLSHVCSLIKPTLSTCFSHPTYSNLALFTFCIRLTPTYSTQISKFARIFKKKYFCLGRSTTNVRIGGWQQCLLYSSGGCILHSKATFQTSPVQSESPRVSKVKQIRKFFGKFLIIFFFFAEFQVPQNYCPNIRLCRAV